MGFYTDEMMAVREVWKQGSVRRARRALKFQEKGCREDGTVLYARNFDGGWRRIHGMDGRTGYD